MVGKGKLMRGVLVFLLFFMGYPLYADDSKDLYERGVKLYQLKKFAQAAHIMDTLPVSYRTYPAQWFRAASHKKAGRTKKALWVVKQAFQILGPVETQPETTYYFYAFWLDCLMELKEYDKLPKAYAAAKEFYHKHQLDFDKYRYHVPRTLYQAGKSARAFSLMDGVFMKLSATSKYKEHVFLLYTKVLCDLNKLEEAVTFADFLSSRKMFIPAVVNPLIKLLYHGAITSLANPVYQKSISVGYLNSALGLVPQTTRYKGSWLDKEVLAFYRDLALFLDNGHKTPVKQPLTLQFLTIAYSRLDAKYRDIGGKLRKVSNKLEADLIEIYEREFILFQRILKFISAGRLIAVNKTIKVDSSVKKITAANWVASSGEDKIQHISFQIPDHTSAEPYPTNIFWSHRNSVDCFVHIYPMQGLPYVAVHGKPVLVYVPGSFKGPSRINLHFHSEAAKRHIALVHEFFHALEYTFNPPKTSGKPPLLVQHVFHPGFEKYRPSWYRGEYELVYYLLAFKHVLLKQDLSKMLYRLNTDRK